ncbi:MAG TPA: PIN domain-containing protein [Terriglobales bacterium]
MIYLDSSVILSALLRERVQPAAAIWSEPLATSRLTLYEVWNRLYAYGAVPEARAAAADLLAGLDFMELTSANLARALEPFPVPVRSLDSLHLASAIALSQTGVEVAFATYDRRLARAAAALDLPLFPL